MEYMLMFVEAGTLDEVLAWAARAPCASAGSVVGAAGDADASGLI